MTTREEQELRDFVHTVDVLTASALAERELSAAPRPAMAGTGLVRHPRLAFAACAGLVLAIGVPVYLTMPAHETGRQVALSRPATPAARPQPQSASPDVQARVREQERE